MKSLFASFSSEKEQDASFSKEKEAKRLLFLSWLGVFVGAFVVVGGPALARAERVVSLNLCTDQLLVLLAPEAVAGLSFLAKDPSLSYVFDEARKFPTVPADAEAVLALHPDLVLAGRYGAQPTVALLKTRVPVAQFDDPTSFPGIAAEIRRLAALLDVQQKGEALIAAMQARLAALPHVARGRAILWEPSGWTAGPKTMADAVLRAAGWQNAGTGGRLGLEALLRARPNLLVTETRYAFPSLATDILRHPALRGLARRTLSPTLLICPGPYTPEAAARLSQ